jgi:hypothetical protein
MTLKFLHPNKLIKLKGHHMNLAVQRIIRQGLTALSGYLVAKGVIAAEAAGSWTSAGVEFLSAFVIFGVGWVWSTVNAKIIAKKKS